MLVERFRKKWEKNNPPRASPCRIGKSHPQGQTSVEISLSYMGTHDCPKLDISLKVIIKLLYGMAWKTTHTIIMITVQFYFLKYLYFNDI